MDSHIEDVVDRLMIDQDQSLKPNRNTGYKPPGDYGRNILALPHLHKDGLCAYCGSILNPNNFRVLGAVRYCGENCYRSLPWCGEDVTTNPPSGEDRREVKKEVAKLNWDKSSVVFGDKESKPTEQEIIGECSVPAYQTPRTDSWVNYVCDPELMALDARELLERYVLNVSKIKNLESYRKEIQDSLNEIEEPKVVTDISEWSAYNYQKQSLEDTVAENILNIDKDIKKYKKENNDLHYLMFYSNEIPNDKWVKVDGYGVFVRSSSDVGIYLKPWDKVLESLEPKEVEKKKKVGIVKKFCEGLVVVVGIAFAAGIYLLILSGLPILMAEVMSSGWGYLVGALIDLLAIGLICGIKDSTYKDHGYE